MLSRSPCKFINVFYLELRGRANYANTVTTHVKSHLKPDMKSSSWWIPASSKANVDLSRLCVKNKKEWKIYYISD